MDIKIRKQLEQLEYIKDKLEYIEYDEALGCYIEKQNGLPTGVAAWVNGAFYGFEQVAIARMEVRINTLDEMLLNQGEALAQAKAQAVPEKDAVIKKLSDQLYAQEMKASAARVLCETACELLDDYAHQDAMVILNDLEQAMKEPAND